MCPSLDILVMRLGKKKEKDRDIEKEQLVDGVARIICSPKSHHAPLRGKLFYENFGNYLLVSKLTNLCQAE